MAIPKEINHYALESIPSIYDEEALTALQLCGRIARKINELISAFSGLSKETQDSLDNFENETIPQEVLDQIQNHIDNGAFDRAIDLYCGNLSARLDNILVNNSTTKDSEVVDARMDHDNITWTTLGDMLRANLDRIHADLRSLVKYQTERVPISYTDGYVDKNGEYISTQDHACVQVEVRAGDRYLILNTYGLEMPDVVVQDQNHNPVRIFHTANASTTNNLDFVFTIPRNAEFMVVNSMNRYDVEILRIVSTASTAFDDDFIKNALASVACGSPNMVEVKTAVYPGWTLKNGQSVSLESQDSRYCAVGTPVEPGKAYYINTAVSFLCNPYVFQTTRDGAPILPLVTGPESGFQEYKGIIYAPPGASYLYMATSPGYEPVIYEVQGHTVEVPEAPEAPEAHGPAYPDWSHLKWYVMGDSLTDPAGGVHTDKFYYEYIQEKTGIQVIVDGIGGTGYYAGASTSQSFADRVKNIPSDVDIVTIFGSGNDIRHGYDTYNPNMTDAMRTLFQTRPGLRVIVVPPSPWKGYTKRGEEWKTYCDRLELLALNYSHRYVDDMFKCPPFDPCMETHIPVFFSKDPEGVHPDENGHLAISRIIYNAMAQELVFK